MACYYVLSVVSFSCGIRNITSIIELPLPVTNDTLAKNVLRQSEVPGCTPEFLPARLARVSENRPYYFADKPRIESR